jgi:hypothetical protein
MELDVEVRQTRQRLLDIAMKQSHELEIARESVAIAIGESCDISRKSNNPEAFVDVALCLLAYPPELAFTIALAMSRFERVLGFQPFGTIMTALCHIETLYQGMYVRLDAHNGKPELEQSLTDKHTRVQRAGRLVAVATLMGAKDLAFVRGTLQNSPCDPMVEVAMKLHLRELSPEIAEAVDA